LPCIRIAKQNAGWGGGIKFLAAAVLLARAVLFQLEPANAQSLEPRAYANTPVGLNFLLAGYAYQQGEVLFAPAVPLKDASVEVHAAVLAYVRSLHVWGKSGKIDLIVPYAWLSGKAKLETANVEEERSREVLGFADPALRFSVNFYGAPSFRSRSSRATVRVPSSGSVFRSPCPSANMIWTNWSISARTDGPSSRIRNLPGGGALDVRSFCSSGPFHEER
jgi:hypothetical protein